MLTGQIIGIGFLVIGMVGISSYTDELARFRVPFFYKELDPMKQRWGNTVGTILHVFEYVVIPLCFGLAFLLGMVI